MELVRRGGFTGLELLVAQFPLARSTSPTMSRLVFDEPVQNGRSENKTLIVVTDEGYCRAAERLSARGRS
ncbi:MAG TPA: hypothetical protein VFT01_01635 [Homoserinimonas sp.]|nr:hypothetical protein [Homoserinimonas sp.]